MFLGVIFDSLRVFREAGLGWVGIACVLGIGYPYMLDIGVQICGRRFITV